MELKGQSSDENFLGLLNRESPPFDYERQLFNDHYQDVAAVLRGENPVPYEIEIQPSSSCNLRCEHCFGKSLTCKRLENLLGLEEFQVIAERIRDFNLNGRRIETVKFCGTTGEPLVNPNTVYAVRIFKQIGKKVVLYTNGLWLDKTSEERIPYMDYFLEADRVNVSLDAGSDSVFRDLKGFNGFARTLNNIGDLVEKARKTRSKLRVDLSYVIGPKNFRDILRATGLAKRLGTNNIIFRVDFTNPDAIREMAQDIIEIRSIAEAQSTDDFKVLFAYSDDEIRKGKQAEIERSKKCFNHHFWACIGPDCQLYTCGHRTYFGVKSFGNVLEKPLEELWLSSERLEAVDKLPDENCRFCSPSCYRRDQMMSLLTKLSIDEVERLHEKYVIERGSK